MKDEPLLKEWLKAIKRENFIATKSSKICSDHFIESDYLDRPNTYKTRLKPDAIPSLIRVNLKKKKISPKMELKRCSKVTETSSLPTKIPRMEQDIKNLSSCSVDESTLILNRTSSTEADPSSNKVAQVRKKIKVIETSSLQETNPQVKQNIENLPSCDVDDSTSSTETDLIPKKVVQAGKKIRVIETSSILQKNAKEERIIENLPSCNVDETDPTPKKLKVSRQHKEVEKNIENLPSCSVDEATSILTQTASTQTDTSKEIIRLRKKIKTLNQRVRRKNKTVMNLKKSLRDLSSKIVVGKAKTGVLSQHVDGVLKELFANKKINKNKTATGKIFSREMKKFAFALYFQSPRVYNYCRLVYNIFIV